MVLVTPFEEKKNSFVPFAIHDITPFHTIPKFSVFIQNYVSVLQVYKNCHCVGISMLISWNILTNNAEPVYLTFLGP